MQHTECCEKCRFLGLPEAWGKPHSSCPCHKVQHTEESNEKEKIILSYPRPYGKTIDAIQEFFVKGRAGKAIIYATPEGNFLSPKAVENLLLSQKKELREKVEGMRKLSAGGGSNVYRDPTWDYNRALDDILKILT